MTAQSIRRRYYLLTGAHTLSASLIWGVNTLFLLDSGLTLAQVFLVNAVFTAAMTLFEIPTGAVADSRGRKVSLQWSSVMLFVGTLGYLAAGTWGGGMAGFIIASVILGIGYTFFSGAAEAWAVDELAAVGEKEAGAKLFAAAGTAAGIMMLAGTIGGGALGSIDYRIPYLGRSLLFLFMLGLTTLAMPETGWKPDGKSLGPWQRVHRTAVDSMQFGFSTAALRQLMMLAFLMGLFMMWGFYALQPYVTDLAGLPGAAWFSGLVTALITVSQIGGQSLAGRAKERKTVGRRIAGGIAVAAVGAAVTGLAGLDSIRSGLGLPGAAITVILGLMLMMGAMGYIMPFQRQALHSRVSSENRATVISLESLVGSGGAIVGQPALGWMSGRWGIPSGYFAGAALMVLMQPVLGRFSREERKPANPGEPPPQQV